MEGEGGRCARFGSDASVMERGGGRIMRGRGVAATPEGFFCGDGKIFFALS